MTGIAHGENRTVRHKKRSESKIDAAATGPHHLAIKIKANEFSVRACAVNVVFISDGCVLSSPENFRRKFVMRMNAEAPIFFLDLQHHAAGVIAAGKKYSATVQNERRWHRRQADF